MKFFNKLSVISLVVLMFSFMNVANADYCKGKQAKSCEDFNKGMVTDDEKASLCNNSFVPSAESHGNQCKWTEVLLPPRPNQDNNFKTKWTCRANGEKCFATSIYR